MAPDQLLASSRRRLRFERAPGVAARSTVQIPPRVDNARAVLNTRQHQLHDAPSMRQALSAAVEQLMVGERMTLEAPRSISARSSRGLHRCGVDADAPLRAYGECSQRYILHVLADDRRCDEEYKDELSRLINNGIVKSSQTSRAQRGITLVPEMAMVVRLFPVNPALPGLAGATDKEGIISLLGSHLLRFREEGWRPVAVDYDVLMRYKPGHPVHDAISGAPGAPTACGHSDTRGFGKVFRDDRWQQRYALLEAAWHAACASGGAWRAARPVVSVPEWRFILQEGVAGRQFRDVVADLPDRATELELNEVEDRLRAVARAVRVMQLAPVSLGPRCDFASLLQTQDSNLAYLRQCQPTLAAELTRLRKELLKLERAIPRQPMVFAHGDFAHGNVLLDGTDVGIVDFDKAGEAEPAYDAAYFLTHLSSFGIRHAERQYDVARLSEAFRHAYLQMAPEVSSRRLSLYEALDLSSYVLRNFRKRSHEDNWLEWSYGQTALAWKRMCHAAGGTGEIAKVGREKSRSRSVATAVQTGVVVSGPRPRVGYLANAFPRIWRRSSSTRCSSWSDRGSTCGSTR